MRSVRFDALMSAISCRSPRADDVDDPLTALMMGGSGMPTPSEFWQDTIITDYIDPATGGNYTPVLVPTPESFASTSVPTGLADLQAAMASAARGHALPCRGIFAERGQIAIDDEAPAHPVRPDTAGRRHLLLLGYAKSARRRSRSSGSPVCHPWLDRRELRLSTVPSRPMPVSPPSTSRTSTTSVADLPAVSDQPAG